MRALQTARVWGWLGKPSVLLFSGVLLASGFMFAKAAKNWAWVSFVRDTRMAKAPIPYGDTSAAVLAVKNTDRNWMLLVRGEQPERRCDDIGPTVRAKLVVIAWRDGDVTMTSCDGGKIGWPFDTASITSAFAARLADGAFALAEPSGRVVYGSLRSRDVARIDQVITLLSEAVP
jgi:hypothetical protein